MPQYRLFYANAKGLSEAIRFILAQAGVEYEDVRQFRDDWAKQHKDGK